MMIKKFEKKIAKDLNVYFWYLKHIRKVKTSKLMDIMLNEREF